MALSDTTLTATIDAHRKTTDSLIVALLKWLWGTWSKLSEPQWSNWSITSGVGAAQYATIQQIMREIDSWARAYANTLIRQIGLNPPTAGPFTYGRANTTIDQVYSRPGQQYRDARDRGLDHQQAVQEAYNRLQDTLDTDRQLIETRAEQDQYDRTKQLTVYRRVLHPELSKSGPCGLCVVAADRVYSKSHLMPLHGRCVCATAPIGVGDAGWHLNRKELNRLYRAAGGTTEGKALSQLRVQVGQHGELGPILTRKQAETRNDPDETSWTNPTPETSASWLRDQIAVRQAQAAAARQARKLGRDLEYSWAKDRNAIMPSDVPDSYVESLESFISQADRRIRQLA